MVIERKRGITPNYDISCVLWIRIELLASITYVQCNTFYYIHQEQGSSKCTIPLSVYIHADYLLRAEDDTSVYVRVTASE